MARNTPAAPRAATTKQLPDSFLKFAGSLQEVNRKLQIVLLTSCKLSATIRNFLQTFPLANDFDVALAENLPAAVGLLPPQFLDYFTATTVSPVLNIVDFAKTHNRFAPAVLKDDFRFGGANVDGFCSRKRAIFFSSDGSDRNIAGQIKG